MTQAARDYFDRVADDWDSIRAGYFTEALRDSAIARAYLRPEMEVADVGCGAGFIAAGLAPIVHRVHALDGSQAMLDVARRNLAAYNNVDYQLTDGSILPLPDASVDAAFANMVLHHCPDPAATLREMARILRPGGRIVITDMDRHDHEWMRAEMADEWLGFERAQVKRWLREAGLVNVLVTCSSQTCCATAQCAPDGRAEISVFIATGARPVSGARAAVQANYAAVAEASRTACGPSCSRSAASPVDSAADIALGGEHAARPADPSEFHADIPLITSCCAPENAMHRLESANANDDVAWITGYTADQLTAVPAAAAGMSLGCGNPTALASLRRGEVVLDIGSGGGIDAFVAAHHVGAEGRVIGLDMTAAMIERARRTASEAGLGQVEFRLGQAEAMPVESGTVDVILSNCVINLCEDKGRVFEEAYRVLREDGRLAISDVVAAGGLPLSVRGNPAAWAGCVSGALPEREYLDLLAAAGFREIEARRSLSGGQVSGVAVYSLSVSARK
jgi:ubiquinone/menaquinone biosynthesis C-methylase UbiE